MAKKFFFLYPSLFSLTVAMATLLKNALAKEKNNNFRLYTSPVVIISIFKRS